MFPTFVSDIIGVISAIYTDIAVMVISVPLT